MRDIVTQLRIPYPRNTPIGDYEVNLPAWVFEMCDEAADHIEALEAEVETLTSSGIAEVAIKNPSVMDYMKHWEGRAEKAEAENARLREALKTTRDKLHSHIHDQYDGVWTEADFAEELLEADAALKGDT